MPADNELVIHVGLPKTGTTWLQRDGFRRLTSTRLVQPNRHTDVFRVFSTIAEQAQPQPRLSRVREQIAAAVTRGTAHVLVSYEPLNSPFGWSPQRRDEVVAALAEVAPGSKILIVVREQSAMLASLYAQYVNQGGYRSFTAFGTGQTQRGRFDPRWLCYDDTVRAYQHTFGCARVLCLPYEMLNHDPETFLRHVAAFIDVDLSTCPYDMQRVNTSPSMAGIACLRISNKLFRASAFNAAPAIVALPQADRVRSFMQGSRLMCYGPKMGPRAASIGRSVSRACAASNRRLKTISGLGVDSWGYTLE